MDSVIKYPIRYGEAAIILYLISLEISNLLLEIKNRSPKASKQVPSNLNVFTPEQIEEARQDYTGFVNSAISVAAKRQEAMNLVTAQLSRAQELVLQVESILALMIQNTSPVTEEEFGRINQARQTLKERLNGIMVIENKLRGNSTTINDLLAKHAEEWRQHYKVYVEKLVSELMGKQILLSELEKQELSLPTKTIEEVKGRLKKEGIIK